MKKTLKVQENCQTMSRPGDMRKNVVIIFPVVFVLFYFLLLYFTYPRLGVTDWQPGHANGHRQKNPQQKSALSNQSTRRVANGKTKLLDNNHSTLA